MISPPKDRSTILAKLSLVPQRSPLPHMDGKIMNWKICRKIDGGRNLQSKWEKQSQHIWVEITGSAFTLPSFVSRVVGISAGHSNKMQDFQCAVVSRCKTSRVDRYSESQSSHSAVANIHLHAIYPWNCFSGTILGENIIIDLRLTDSSKDKKYCNFFAAMAVFVAYVTIISITYITIISVLLR